MSADLASILRCPTCHGGMAEEAGGGFKCLGCGRSFPFTRGVSRFVDPENYADSFGFQWQKYSRTQLDDATKRDSEEDFLKKAGLTPEEVRGKLILDVGCGMGRYAEVATRWGARVVGIDLSAAAEVAARNLADRDFVALQADVFALPFAPESFDIIYSIGVLHHTPDCEQAVKVLPQYLKPGGILAVWLYSAYNKWYRFSDIYRKVTPRMSPRSLHAALRVAVPTFYNLGRGLSVLPLVGRPLAGFVHHLFPVNRNPNPQWRVLDTFDWYAPKYQSKHTYEQVFRWFESCGLEDLRVIETPIAVKGHKPATGARRQQPETVSMELRTP
ncbi:MAG: class I SAM-dependent methyltransferase [Acidobacteriia bacterium]|nr:class I SAM-dependent methyltransferase [Terriglobia bacterium]